MSPEGIKEIYVDELTSLMLGYPISKISFSSTKQVTTVGDTKKTEVMTVAIPTNVLLQTCNFVVNHIQNNQEYLLNAAQENSKQLATLMQNKSTDETASSQHTDN